MLIPTCKQAIEEHCLCSELPYCTFSNSTCKSKELVTLYWNWPGFLLKSSKKQLKDSPFSVEILMYSNYLHCEMLYCYCRIDCLFCDKRRLLVPVGFFFCIYFICIYFSPPKLVFLLTYMPYVWEIDIVFLYHFIELCL